MNSTRSTAKRRKPSYIEFTHENIKLAGAEILRRSQNQSNNVFKRRWMAMFGVTIKTCVTLWRMFRISSDNPSYSGVEAKHLLWALMRLKLYGSEEEMATLCGGIDEQTYRKWSRLLTELILDYIFEVIVWENRKSGDIGNDCLVSVDCTDCMVSKIGDAEFASFKTHKFKHAGLRYEIAVCILTGDIVWVMGPFPCGDWPDINIFRFAIKHMLDDNERVEADDGYIGEDPLTAKVPASMVHNQDQHFLAMRSYVRHRHETVNKRMKQFKILSTQFRGPLEDHGVCFRAVAVLTQLEINNGARLFDVTYSDEYFDLLPQATTP